MIHPSAAVTYYCDCPEIAKRNVRHASLGRKINTIRPRRQKETGCTLYGVWSSTFRVDVRECNIADQAGVISKEEDTASNTRGKYTTQFVYNTKIKKKSGKEELSTGCMISCMHSAGSRARQTYVATVCDSTTISQTPPKKPPFYS